MIYFYLGGGRVKHFTAQWRNSSIPPPKKTDRFHSFVNRSPAAMCSLFLSVPPVCLSVCLRPSSIHNHCSAGLHQHPSLFMEYRSQGWRGEKSRGREKDLESGAERRLLSTLLPNDLPDRNYVSTHFQSDQSFNPELVALQTGQSGSPIEDTVFCKFGSRLRGTKTVGL